VSRIIWVRRFSASQVYVQRPSVSRLPSVSWVKLSVAGGTKTLPVSVRPPAYSEVFVTVGYCAVLLGTFSAYW
jgi:hypothetical protein